jgi:hypothetical protein
MRCSQVSENLSEYRRGRLDEKLSSAIQDHLGHCAECARQQRLEGVVNMLLAATRQTVEPPPFFAAKVCAKVGSLKADVEHRRGLFVWWDALRGLVPPVLVAMLLMMAFTIFPWVMNRPSSSASIEDLATHNASSEERMILSNEELSQSRVGQEVLPWVKEQR